VLDCTVFPLKQDQTFVVCSTEKVSAIFWTVTFSGAFSMLLQEHCVRTCYHFWQKL